MQIFPFVGLMTTIEILVQNKDHLTELVSTIKKAHKYIEVERIESLNLN